MNKSEIPQQLTPHLGGWIPGGCARPKRAHKLVYLCLNADMIQTRLLQAFLSGAMINESIAQSDVQYWHSDSGRSQDFVHAAAGTSRQSVFLHRYQANMFFGREHDGIAIQRFHETHIDQGGIHMVCDGTAGLYHAAERQYGNIPSAAD